MGPKKKQQKKKDGCRKQPTVSSPTKSAVTIPEVSPPARMPKGFNVDDFLFSKLFKSVNVEGARTINVVLRSFFRQRMTEESSSCTIGQIIEMANLSKKAHNFISRYGKNLFEKNPLTAEFDISCGIRLLEEVFWEEYRKLSRHCQAQIHALRELRNSLSHKYPLDLQDFVTHNEKLEKLLEKNVDFITLDHEIIKLEEEKTGLDAAGNISEIQACIDEKKKEKYFVIEIEKLRIILSDILENVSSILKEDFTNCKKMVDENLTTISSAKVQQYDQDTYNKEVQTFKDDPMHKLITEGREELKNQYRCLKIANPCPWIDMNQREKLSINNFSIEKIYTPLRIEGSRDEITTENLLVSAKKVDTKTCKSNALVLSGLPGSGKTSLCLHFLHHWTEGTNEIGMLQDYSLVIYIQVRMVRSDNIVSYLKEQRMKSSTSSIDAEDLVQQLDDLKLFFIIDGYDEAKEDSKKKGVVHDIFAKFPNQRILVTTRTECQEKVTRAASKYSLPCKVLEVCGFDESKIEKFTEKVFDAVKSNSSKLDWRTKKSSDFLHYVQGRGKILEKHLELPLTLALMIYMWIDCPEVLSNVTTCTSLYYELFKLCQEKINDRLDFRVPVKDLEKLLILVGKKAWQLLRNEEEVLLPEDEKEIDEECKRRKIPKEELLSAFLMCESDGRSEEINYDYSFMHRTQMEYLSAYFWAEEAGKEKGLHDITKSIPSSFGFHQIIIFLVGHLTREEMLDQMLEDIFRLLAVARVEEDDYNFWWNFLTESQIDGEVSENLAGDMVRKTLKKKNWKLSQTNVVSGLELLIATPVQLNDLVIDIEKGTDPYDIKNFLNIMRSLRRKLYGRYGKDNPIRTELFFWEHYVTKCKKPSNDLLWTLKPWGHLIDFTGSVEKYYDNFMLNYCFKMKNLRVRVQTDSAQVSLCKSLEKISRKIRQLRVILALNPEECHPTSLASLTCESFTGKLELTLPHMEDNHKDWIVEVVKRVSGQHRCYKLFLEKSNLTFCTVLYIMKMLRDVVTEKYTIGNTEYPTDEQRIELEEKKKKERIHVEVAWLDG